jgi:hypothetical protein
MAILFAFMLLISVVEPGTTYQVDQLVCVMENTVAKNGEIVVDEKHERRFYYYFIPVGSSGRNLGSRLDNFL